MENFRQKNGVTKAAISMSLNNNSIVDDVLRSQTGEYYNEDCDCHDDLNLLIRRDRNYKDGASDEMTAALSRVHPEVKEKFMGCGNLSPELLQGLHVIDLGSGNGRDSFALSDLVGSTGSVLGVDLASKQVEFCRSHTPYHTQLYGYQSDNITFQCGTVEDLKSLHVSTQSKDLVYSNGVICLAPNKQAVYEEIHRVLKHGGELHFYDVYSNRGLLQDDQLVSALMSRDVWGSGMGGAYWLDTVTALRMIGFTTPRFLKQIPACVNSKELAKKIGHVQYSFIAYRAFKLPEDRENVPKSVTYNGKIKQHPDVLEFDYYTKFKAGEPVAVDGELADILQFSRFRPYFTFTDTQHTPAQLNVEDPFQMSGSG